MQHHGHESHQQKRLPEILLCIHVYRQQRLAGYARFSDSQTNYTKVALSTPLLRQLTGLTLAFNY
jgi:hypothetical protein